MTLQFCKTRSCLQRTLERVGVWEVHARDNHRQLVISREIYRREAAAAWAATPFYVPIYVCLCPGAVNAAHYFFWCVSSWGNNPGISPYSSKLSALPVDTSSVGS